MRVPIEHVNALIFVFELYITIMHSPGRHAAPLRRRSSQKLFTAFVGSLLAVLLTSWAAYAGASAAANVYQRNVNDVQKSTESVDGGNRADASFATNEAGATVDVDTLPPHEAAMDSLEPPPQVLTQFHQMRTSKTSRGSEEGPGEAKAKPSMVAVISRYADDILWFEDSEPGVMDNSTGTPQFLMPLVVYQAADIGRDGHPVFPGLPDRSNISTDLAKGPAYWPAWPEWAVDWVERKNAVQPEVIPGSSQDAARAMRMKLGLPIKSSKKNTMKGVLMAVSDRDCLA